MKSRRLRSDRRDRPRAGPETLGRITRSSRYRAARRARGRRVDLGCGRRRRPVRRLAGPSTTSRSSTTSCTRSARSDFEARDRRARGHHGAHGRNGRSAPDRLPRRARRRRSRRSRRISVAAPRRRPARRRIRARDDPPRSDGRRQGQRGVRDDPGARRPAARPWSARVGSRPRRSRSPSRTSFTTSPESAAFPAHGADARRRRPRGDDLPRDDRADRAPSRQASAHRRGAGPHAAALLLLAAPRDAGEASVARPLIEGLRNATIAHDDRIRTLVPFELTPFDEAARAAIEGGR